MPLKLVAIGAQAPLALWAQISAPCCRGSTCSLDTVWAESVFSDDRARSAEWDGQCPGHTQGRGRRGRRRATKGRERGQGRRNRWVLGIPGLLLLELFAVVLFTVDAGTAVTVLFTGDEDLLLAVAGLLPAGRKVGRGGGVRRRDLTTFPPGLVVGEVEVELLVGGGGAGAGLARLLLVVVAVRRGEDAEGDGDSRFKIQVDCLVWARRVVLLSTS